MATGVSRNWPSSRRVVHFALGLLIIGAVTVAIVGGGGPTRSSTAQHLVTDQSPLIGHQAPGADVPGLTRRRIRSADFVGRVVVVNFWASWCVPCRAEAPLLEPTFRHWRSRGVTVVGIAWHDLRVDANGFRRAHHLSYPLGIDENETAGPAYGVVALPATFVIDSHGIVRASIIGQLRAGLLDDAIRQALRD